jgi:hypothetical protein
MSWIWIAIVVLWVISFGFLCIAANQKNWRLELVAEFAFYGAFGLMLFTVFSSVFPVVILLFAIPYWNFIQHKPFKSKLYRLPLKTLEGKIVLKRVCNPIFTTIFREWIMFNAVNGQQIKVYVPMAFNSVEYWNLSTLNIGDFATLRYRKGRKHLYFESFEKHEPVAEEAED